jgi:hypothetical protein
MRERMKRQASVIGMIALGLLLLPAGAARAQEKKGDFSLNATDVRQRA